MLLLPITTHSLPEISTSVLFSISMIPAGVHGRNVSSPITILPTFTGWNPSTSLLLSIASKTLLSSMCFGSGNCTKIPFTALSSFKSLTTFKSSSSVVSSGSANVLDVMPTYSHAFSLFLT